MSETRVTQGGDLMMYLGGKSIAQATSHTLTITGETAETTSKDNGGYWKSFDFKSASWTLSSENMYSDSTDGKTFKDLWDAFSSKTPFEVVFGPKSATDEGQTNVPTGGWTAPTTGCFKGKVIITSLTVTAANGDNATFSAEFQGSGELEWVE